MSRADRHGNLSNSRLLRSRADLLREAGAHEGAFQAADVPDHGDIKKLKQSAFVEVDKRSAEGRRYEVQEYRLAPDAREYLRTYLEERETMLPCGHNGLQNHGDHYECGYEGCGREFSAAEVLD